MTISRAWFVSTDVASAMQYAINAGTAPSAAECRDHELAAAAAVKQSMLLTSSDGVLTIPIEGVLTEQPSLWALIFGGANATYADIRAALASAETDPAVRSVLLKINSPGGNVDGLFETLAAIQAFRKPITTQATLACSAAYALAAMTSSIQATMPAATFGSIGVAATFLIADDEVTVTSTEAPNKRPDMRTAEGVAVVRKQLDDLHALFVGDIAAGRRVSVDAVNADFGRGSVLLAAEAITVGMIDGMAAAPPRRMNARALSLAPTKRTQTMDTLAELKAAFPALVAEAQQEGVATERDRVVAHLTLGEQSGDLKTAVGAITDGTGMTLAMTAKYMAAGMNRNAVAARQTETDATAAVAASALVAPEAAAAAAGVVADLGDQIVNFRKNVG